MVESTAKADTWGIIANVIEADRVFRMGAKLWLYARAGSERAMWTGLSRSPRPVTKWSAIERLDNFRVRWVPEHQRDGSVWMRLDRAEAEQVCGELAELAAAERAAHPNRRAMQDATGPGAAPDPA